MERNEEVSSVRNGGDPQSSLSPFSLRNITATIHPGGSI
jgi:hypothetical protein